VRCFMRKNCVLLNRLSNLGTDQSGAIAVTAAIAMVMLLGFAALAWISVTWLQQKANCKKPPTQEPWPAPGG
jgi:hypothetical protein